MTATVLCWAVAMVAASSMAQQRQGDVLANATGNFHLLMYRPLEPIFYAKGDNEDVYFNVPENFVPPLYQMKAAEFSNRSAGSTTVEVPSISIPDISLPMELGRQDHFSTFVPYHRRMARRLVDIFMNASGPAELLATAAYCRDRLNPLLWAHALAVALRHRADTRAEPLPLLAGRFPARFFDGASLPLARRSAHLLAPRQRRPLEIPMDFTATDQEPEHRVAYYREDIGINLAHWHWHLIYPFAGNRSIVDKDRRGELFYYFHQQIVARYNAERLSNGLGRAERLVDLRAPLPEAYFPKLDGALAGRAWPARPAYARLQNIRRKDYMLFFDLNDLERWRDRIYEAIHNGHALAENGTLVKLSNHQGIDILGNIVESTEISIHKNYYGDMHNLGHIAIALVHDPDGRHLERVGVMGDAATTVRDPMFYRWHGFIDDLFQEHKKTLVPYTTQELTFYGINVTGVEVQTQGLARANELNTFWQKSDIDLSRGLDFAPRGAVFVRVTHLQHTPFSYRIQVFNFGPERRGTVRIFMAPRYDEQATQFSLREQRIYFIELDKFQYDFQPGNNTVRRSSLQSSVTIPYEQTFRDLGERPGADSAAQQSNYCGCGWPQHMLIPKGSEQGFPVELFVMVSDYAHDKVEQTPLEPPACTGGPSYCGVFGQKYPDRRPMGFPFDRNPRPGASTLAQFLTPNMFVTPLTIKFSKETRASSTAFNYDDGTLRETTARGSS